MMKRMTTLLAGILATGMSLSAQVWAHKWAKGLGSSGSNTAIQYTYAVTNDGTTTYAAGKFTGSLTLNGYTANGGGTGNAFIAKFDASGNCTGFTDFGSGDANVRALVIVGSTIYVTGIDGGYYYMGKISTGFSNGAAVTQDVIDLGEGRGLATDGANIFVTGEMDQGMVLPAAGGGSITLTGHSTYHSMFVAKFATSNFTTTVAYTSAVEPYSSSNTAEANGITYYNGYAYITGFFRGNLQMTSSIGSSISATGYSDLFVATVNASTGSFVTNAIRYGGSSASTLYAEQYDAGYGIAANANGIFVAGGANGAYTFDSQSSSTSTYMNSVLIKYPISSGIPGAASWVNLGAPAISTGTCFGTAVSLGGSGNVYMTGCYETGYGATYYGQVSTSLVIPAANNGGSVTWYSQSTGKLVGGFTLTSLVTGTAHRPQCIYADGCNNFWYGGGIWNDVTVGNLTMTSGPGYPHNTDCFVAQASGQLTVTANVTTCPGTSVPLTASFGRNTTYTWSPTTNLSCGVCQSPNFSTTTPGTYTINVYASNTLDCDANGQVVIHVQDLVTADAGPDIRRCVANQHIGTPAQTGATYSWSPTTGLVNPNTAQPQVTAAGTYTVTVTGPCNTATDVVTVSPYDATLCHNEGYCQICPPPGSSRLAGPGAEVHPFDVFPNPANGLFNVQFSDGGQHTITVTDLAGREVFRTETNEGAMQLDLRTSGKGVYLLKVRDGGAEAIRKLIVE